MNAERGRGIPAAASETGRSFLHSHCKKSARFPAAQTAWFHPANPAVFPPAAAVGITHYTFVPKVVCHETSGFFGFFRSKGNPSPLHAPEQGELRSPCNPHAKGITSSGLLPAYFAALVRCAAKTQKPAPRGVLVFVYTLVYFAARYRKVTICALTQSASGEKVVSLVPSVMPFATAQFTASS